MNKRWEFHCEGWKSRSTDRRFRDGAISEDLKGNGSLDQNIGASKLHTDSSIGDARTYFG